MLRLQATYPLAAYPLAVYPQATYPLAAFRMAAYPQASVASGYPFDCNGLCWYAREQDTYMDKPSRLRELAILARDNSAKGLSSQNCTQRVRKRARSKLLRL